jgi:hypothetical protein
MEVSVQRVSVILLSYDWATERNEGFGMIRDGHGLVIGGGCGRQGDGKMGMKHGRQRR